MQKIEIVNKIEERLLKAIRAYHSSNAITHLTPEDIEDLRVVWKEIMGTPVQTNCPSCIRFCLDVINSYYTREVKKVKPKLQEPEPDTTPVLKIKKCKGCK